MTSRLCCVVNTYKRRFGSEFSEPICHACHTKLCDVCMEANRGCKVEPSIYNDQAHHCIDCSYVCGPNLGKENNHVSSSC
jgi:hypothetical protein